MAAFAWMAALPAGAALAFGPVPGAGTLEWKFATGNRVWSSPAMSPDGSVVYVGSNDDSLHAVHAADGTAAWKFATRQEIVSSPALSPDGSTVYAGSLDDNLYAVHAADGTAARKP